jgi:hypothetical protein
MAELYATWLSGGAKHELFDAFAIDRFSRGPVAREDFIIG